MATTIVDPTDRLTGAARVTYETTMVVLALGIVALLVADVPHAGPLNAAIWLVFVVDYAARLALSGDRRAFMRANVADLVAVMPLDMLRVARLARLARLVRAGRVLWRATGTLRALLDTNGLQWVLAASAATVLAGAGLVWLVEPQMGSIGDALWWSLVTSTTVGYGDLSPTTGFGRAVAAVLMIVGVGTIGMLTGSISTFFIRGQNKTELPAHVAFVRDELARWNELDGDERRRMADLLRSLASD